MAKRRCHGTTKAGKDCQAAPLHDSEFCLAHSDAETRSSVQFVGGQPGSGRPRNPRVVEVMRERIEADIEMIVRPYFEAIEHAVMTATYEGDVIASDVADLGARIAAAEKLLDRVYGKPKQAIEHAGPDSVPLTVEVNLDEKARKALGDVLRRRPATGSV